MGIIYEEKSRQFHLYNDKISYIMTCLPNGQMGQLYYGKRLRHRESFGHLLEFAHRDMAPCVYENDTTFSLEHIRQEYPAFGTGDMRYPAYGIRRENGSRVSCFVYKSHIIQGENRNCRVCLLFMWSRIRRRRHWSCIWRILWQEWNWCFSIQSMKTCLCLPAAPGLSAAVRSRSAWSGP